MPILSSWNRLQTGLVAAVVTALVALAILVYGRVGRLHGATVQLHVATGNSLGLIRGSDVWLDGEKVGTVDAITLRPPGSESQRTVITITVMRSALSHFRSDTRASIKSGGSLLGTPVLFALSGTDTGRPLRPMDTLTLAAEQPGAVIQVDSTLHQIPTLLAGLGAVAHDVSWISQRATGGDRRTEIAQELGHMQGSATVLSSRLAASRLTDSVLAQRVSRALSHVDSLRSVVQGNAIALQRIRRDTAFASALTESRRDLVALQRVVGAREGTVARMQSDSSVDRQLRHAIVEVNRLIADVSKHPLRYIAF